MEKQTSVAPFIYKLQCQKIGQRFAGAQLSDCRLSNGDARDVLEWAKNKKNGLILMGIPGTGKTYVCAAMLAWMHGKVGDLYYWKESQFFERIHAIMDTYGTCEKEVELCMDHEFVILDDLGSTGQGQGDWKQGIYFQVVDSRYDSKKPTLYSTNLTEDQIKTRLGERVHSRLFGSENTIVRMFNYPDLRQAINWRDDAPKPGEVIR